jgi:hypothetical protein
MPPITRAIRKRIEADYDRRVAKASTDGIETIKAGAILAAQGDVGAADALRIILKARGVGDDGFVRIVAAAR